MPLEKNDLAQYVKLASGFKNIPQRDFYLSYDADGDVAYINFQNPAQSADDSELRDDNVLVRYDDTGNVIGLTILHASKREAMIQLPSSSSTNLVERSVERC